MEDNKKNSPLNDKRKETRFPVEELEAVVYTNRHEYKASVIDISKNGATVILLKEQTEEVVIDIGEEIELYFLIGKYCGDIKKDTRAIMFLKGVVRDISAHKDCTRIGCEISISNTVYDKFIEFEEIIGINIAKEYSNANRY